MLLLISSGSNHTRAEVSRAVSRGFRFSNSLVIVKVQIHSLQLTSERQENSMEHHYCIAIMIQENTRSVPKSIIFLICKTHLFSLRVFIIVSFKILHKPLGLRGGLYSCSAFVFLRPHKARALFKEQKYSSNVVFAIKSSLASEHAPQAFSNQEKICFEFSQKSKVAAILEFIRLARNC